MSGHNKQISGAADIGNSRVKLFIVGMLASLDYTPGWEDEALTFLSNFNDYDIKLGFSSVSSVRLLNLQDKLSGIKHIKLIDTAPLLHNQKKLNLNKVKGMGSDRLLGLLGAMSHMPPPLITIDCGTAVTINAVDSSGYCLGGTISAGIFTQAKALHEHTSALPEADLFYEPAASGRDTRHALRSGIIHSVAGGIKETVRKIVNQEFCGREVPVFITGGSAPILLKALNEWIVTPIHKPNLVPEGIISLID